MRERKLALEHCYGICNREAILGYGKSPTASIYAPNGAMKCTFANNTAVLDVGAKFWSICQLLRNGGFIYHHYPTP